MAENQIIKKSLVWRAQLKTFVEDKILHLCNVEMDTKQELESIAVDDRLQNVINNLSQCKIDFLTRNEECENLRDINNRLEMEIKEVRELENSHCQHLDISRQMINNLQETVSQLMYVKRDVKLLKEQISSKEAYIREMEKVQENELQKQNEKVFNIQADYRTQIEELKTNNAMEIQQKQHECDAKVAMVTCDVEELKAKMREMESAKRERINIAVLEYEEKLQQQAILKAQLQEQLSRETARSDLNINTYRRRLEELEEKVKHSQFQQYLQNIYTSPYGTQIEKPHSSRNQQEFLYVDPNKNKPQLATPSQYKPPKCTNSLQVIYDNKEKTKSNKKKDMPQPRKRKLFNANEFLD